jgi:hypothetical protein
VDEDRYGWCEDGADFPRWLAWAVAAGFAVVAVCLLLLWVDLRHDYHDRPHTVGVTPHTYGPPPR